MSIEVLLSCMHQTDLALVSQSRISGDVLIINQADEDSKVDTVNKEQRIRMITTRERGLSRSRNMAIHNAKGDICLLCDDDEEFVEKYEQLIEKAFCEQADADIIAFDVENKETRLKKRRKRLNRLDCLKIASFQIAFRRRSILEKNIKFDEFMGAGTGNGGSEENKFLWDCLDKGLVIYYQPVTIAALHSKSSTWFFGYNSSFFYQRGAATRYMMGSCLSVSYAFYYLIAKYRKYCGDISMFQAACALFHGIWENPIYKQIIERNDI